MQLFQTEVPVSPTKFLNWLLTIEQHKLYGWFVTSCGLILMLWGVYGVAVSSNILNFTILLCLVCIGSIPATSSALTKIARFTFSVSTVVAIASIPSLGPGPAAVLASSSHLFLWFFKPKDPLDWQKSWTQLGFNSAMNGLAMGAAGYLYVIAGEFLSQGVLQISLAWILAVALFVTTDLIILFIMVRLQYGAEMTARSFLTNIGWSIALGFLVHALGGGFLAYSMAKYDTQSIIIFFLPIFLSAFAFQLYTREMQAHMDNLEEIVAERTKELAQLNSEKDSFLAVLTHDMGSPLNTIKLTMEMIQHKPTILVERPQLAERIVRSQTMLQQLVSDIVDLGRMEAGKPLELKKADVDLVKLTKDIVEEQISRASLKSIQLQSSHAEETINILADGYQVQRVLTNLITNAIKYTPHGGQIDINICKDEDETEGEMAKIMIKDSGYGIPETELSSIFERYQRVSANSDKARGAGLGLSITKAIIDAHDGTVKVKSEIDTGSTFWVRLPLYNGNRNASKS